MATSQAYSTRDIQKTWGVPKAGVYERLNAILGYDLEETVAVRESGDLQQRVIARLNTQAASVPAEDVLGDLDK